MLPNFFPEGGQAAEYNTADATLWYFELVRQYGVATGDIELVRELFPVLAEIVDWHVKGTRYNIRVDQQDGLLHAGEAGVALTWMDAKVGGVPVTPRIGKPVEINALWYNALRTMARFAVALNKSPNVYAQLAEKSHVGFARFWNAQANCCFDVLDTPAGNDATLRPESDFRRVPAGESLARGAARRRREFLRAASTNASRPALPRPRRSPLSSRLRRAAGGA